MHTHTLGCVSSSVSKAATAPPSEWPVTNSGRPGCDVGGLEGRRGMHTHVWVREQQREQGRHGSAQRVAGDEQRQARVRHCRRLERRRHGAVHVDGGGQHALQRCKSCES
jgi:hypothetical protein